MSNRLTKLNGAGWLVFGAWFLGADLVELLHGATSLSWSYYLTSWSYLALCLLAGALLLSGHTIGKWLVTALAALLFIYAGLLWGKAEAAPPLFQLWCATMIAFAVWSIYLVQRRNA